MNSFQDKIFLTLVMQKRKHICWADGKQTRVFLANFIFVFQIETTVLLSEISFAISAHSGALKHK